MAVVKNCVHCLFCLSLSAVLFAQTEPNNVPAANQGVLQLPECVSVYVTAPDGVKKLIDPNDGRALLPVGAYQMHYWVCRKKDNNGRIWRLNGYGSPIKNFKIGEEPTHLDIKPEPVNVSLSIRARDGYVFIMSLNGPAGERLYLYEENNKSPQPPPIVITNQDKSFSVTLTGKYG